MLTSKGGSRDFKFSREIASSALDIYIEHGLSVKNPVQCLDLSSTREESKRWLDKFGPSIKILKTTSKSNCDENAETHTKDDHASEESNFAFIEKSDFNFIYLECTTEGSSYFDCVFRKIARNGLFVISTHDDPALYGRPADPALRCYGGHIVRTFYSTEMAVRLITAAMARSAARFSKSIEVLLAVVIKNSITMILQVRKGADSAVKCIKEIKTLIHCSVCEERAFLPLNDGFVTDRVSEYLSCCCAGESVGRTIMALGPLWAGPIGSPTFLSKTIPRASHSVQITTFLQELISELRCESKERNDSKNTETVSNPTEMNLDKENSADTLDKNSLKRKHQTNDLNLNNKKPKYDTTESDPAPAFYYNLHKHKPKGTQKLIKVDKIIEKLRQNGFRASRTHFDRAAIKTSCSLRELQHIIAASL